MLAKHPIQLKYLTGLFLKCSVALIAGTVLSSAIAWRAFGSRAAPDYGGALGQIGAMQASLIGVTILCTAAQVLLAIGLLWMIGIYASNKIAGPLVRFERCVIDLGKGNLAQSIQFRAGDQEQSLPRTLQVTCARLRGEVSRGRDCAETISALIESLREESAPGLSTAEAMAVRAVLAHEKEKLEALAPRPERDAEGLGPHALA